MQVFRLDDGRVVRLGKELASAGEGVVSEVIGHPEWVAKIYHAHLPEQGLAARDRKVRAMAAAKPPGAEQADGFVVLAWPEHAVVGPDNRVRGFVMRRIDTVETVEVHRLSNPADRADPNPKGPQWPKKVTWLHLVNIARNLCRAVDTAHTAGAVIGDFNERNILVADTTLVSLVDCDSFQFRSGSTVHPCGVARPEFLAPELASVDLARHIRDKSSDLFVLAIHIYLLLMAGNHPFSRGDWTGRGEKPDALALAVGGHWAGGARSKLKCHPAAPEVGMLPVPVRDLFERALGAGARQPARRPSAAEWERALAAITSSRCARDTTHYYPDRSRDCPWCALAERQNGGTRVTARSRAKTLPTRGTGTARVTTCTATLGTKPRGQTTAIGRAATVTRPSLARPAATRPPATARTSKADPVVTERREIDRTVGRLVLGATSTCLTPWLLGHYLLRGSYLPVSGEVYNDEIRAWWPYFWAELRGGWALLWLLAAVFLLVRPWRGRWLSLLAGVALLSMAIWVGPGAADSFASAERTSVAELDSTRFPFSGHHTTCGSVDVGVRASEHAPVHSLWQMYVFTDSGEAGSVCDQVAVYHGWQETASLRLPDGIAFEDFGSSMSVYFQDVGESYPSGWAFWDYDLSRVWLTVHTTNGRVVSTNLRDAAHGGLALR
ncbi:hypothetical protein IU449_11480 [Nocardia higoensis]|uniref:Protein kinase domain-containing protein n=1 Tax=Nocardia higoensis TaxID=228599 RepID=A0ABS0DE06_9NOCA|nr:hypothetical protein [Nocardia higoensis]MBF6355154.1 hypothetical protein [Nocardia higoensis]